MRFVAVCLVFVGVFAIVGALGAALTPARAAPPDYTHRQVLALEANTRALQANTRALARCRCP